MRKLTALLLALAVSASANANSISRFGLITDIHYTNKTDTATRKYSAAVSKTQKFVDTMNAENVDFVIELGDYVDTLVDGKDPVQNFNEVENVYQQFNGNAYHVLGNHDMDNLTRDSLLGMMTNGSIPQGQTYYSFDTAGIHCVVLDADYTVAEPHDAFDIGGTTTGDLSWNWKDAYVIEEEMNWLISDLASSDLPTLVFSHQTLNREDSQNHNIKNASDIRSILEQDGDVLACFSGHDHAGDFESINGIEYFVMLGNVGTSDSIGWDEISPLTQGYDDIIDNQYSIIEVSNLGDGQFNINIDGYGYQSDYNVTVPEPATLSLIGLGGIAAFRRRK